jgi:hypothetical protein
MTQLPDDELRKKIFELDDQMKDLTIILGKMVDKMDRIEQATVSMRDDIMNDMAELKDDTDIDPDDRNT